MPGTEHRRNVGLLALFALAVQLLSTFGHLPHYGQGRPLEQRTLTAYVQGGGQPAGQRGHDHRDGSCLICWVAGLVASSAVPTPPEIPLPAFTDGARVRLDQPALTLARLTLSFQARGPPV